MRNKDKQQSMISETVILKNHSTYVSDINIYEKYQSSNNLTRKQQKYRGNNKTGLYKMSFLLPQ
jgi:hypothetical protein